MSKIILILGESGTGKSTSIRNLDPKETYIINVLSKPLPFRAYNTMYNDENKNYLESDRYQEVVKYLRAINDRRPEIKNIVLDDFSFLMCNDYMRRAHEEGWDKYKDMGINMYSVMDMCQQFRDDLFIYILSHTEYNKKGQIAPKTVGNMVTDYVGIAERATIAFHTQIIDREYKFATQNNGICIAKTPMGMFKDMYIDNDLAEIRKVIEEYYPAEPKPVIKHKKAA